MGSSQSKLISDNEEWDSSIESSSNNELDENDIKNDAEENESQDNIGQFEIENDTISSEKNNNKIATEIYSDTEESRDADHDEIENAVNDIIKESNENIKELPSDIKSFIKTEISETTTTTMKRDYYDNENIFLDSDDEDNNFEELTLTNPKQCFIKTEIENENIFIDNDDEVQNLDNPVLTDNLNSISLNKKNILDIPDENCIVEENFHKPIETSLESCEKSEKLPLEADASNLDKKFNFEISQENEFLKSTKVLPEKNELKKSAASDTEDLVDEIKISPLKKAKLSDELDIEVSVPINLPDELEQQQKDFEKIAVEVSTLPSNGKKRQLSETQTNLVVDKQFSANKAEIFNEIISEACSVSMNNINEENEESPSKRLRLSTSSEATENVLNSIKDLPDNNFLPLQLSPNYDKDKDKNDSKGKLENLLENQKKKEDKIEKELNEISEINSFLEPTQESIKNISNSFSKDLPFQQQTKKISLNFLSKNFNNMTRNDLEELVLQKIVEAIIFKSDFVDLHKTLETQEKIITNLRAKLEQLIKQYADLNMLYQSVKKDLQARNAEYIIPKRVVRSVALQANLINLSTLVSNKVSVNMDTSSSNKTKTVLCNDKNDNNFLAKNPEKSTNLQVIENKNDKETVSSKSTLTDKNENTQSDKPVESLITTKQTSKDDNFTNKPNIMTGNSSQNLLKNLEPSKSSIAKSSENSQLLEKSERSQPITLDLHPRLPEISAVENSYPSQQSEQSKKSKPILVELDPIIPENSSKHILNDINFSNSSQSSTSSVDNQFLKKIERSKQITLDLDSHLSQNTVVQNSQPVQQLEPSKKLMPILVDLDPVIREKSSNQIFKGDNFSNSLPPTTSMTNSVLLDQPTLNFSVPQKSAEKDSHLLKTTGTTNDTKNKSNNENRQQLQKENGIIDLSNDDDDDDDLPQQRFIQPRALPRYNQNNINLNTHQPLIPFSSNENFTASRTNHIGVKKFAPNPLNLFFKNQHPPSLPLPPPLRSWKSHWKLLPPKPKVVVNIVYDGIEIVWNIQEPLNNFAKISSYEIFLYHQKNAPPSTELWQSLGFVKPISLPMAVTLTQFPRGQRYYFAVRAIDVYDRYGPFSEAQTWR